MVGGGFLCSDFRLSLVRTFSEVTIISITVISEHHKSARLKLYIRTRLLIIFRTTSTIFTILFTKARTKIAHCGKRWHLINKDTFTETWHKTFITEAAQVIMKHPPTRRQHQHQYTSDQIRFFLDLKLINICNSCFGMINTNWINRELKRFFIKNVLIGLI